MPTKIRVSLLRFCIYFPMRARVFPQTFRVSRVTLFCENHASALSLITRFEKEAPPACAVTFLRSRTGAKGGVNRGCKRLTVETVLHTCNRQAATPRWKFRVGRIQVGIEHCRRRQSDFRFFECVLTRDRVAANHSVHCQHGRI